MTNQADPNRLDNILQEYFETVETPNHKSLLEWTRRYPEYKTELTEFTVAWIQLKQLPPVEIQAVDETTIVLRGMSAIQNILHGMSEDTRPHPSVEVPFSSLIKESGKVGLALNQLAERARLSVPIVRKLDLHQISPTTIPDQVIQTFAELLQKSMEAMSTYFYRPVQAIPNPSFRSDRAPRIVQQDFFEAIRKDKLMKEEDRQYWLSYKSQDKHNSSQ
jgi:hypothetical protein